MTAQKYPDSVTDANNMAKLNPPVLAGKYRNDHSSKQLESPRRSGDRGAHPTLLAAVVFVHQAIDINNILAILLTMSLLHWVCNSPPCCEWLHC